MDVFVTGGTGAIGGHAVPALVGAGHRVRALARSEESAAALTAAGAVPVRVSLFDAETLTRAVDRADAVVNLASALPPTARFVFASAWDECYRVRSAGSAAVVDAALAAGVPRVVQESVAMIYADRGAEWIDESAALDHYPIARGNHAAEASARRFAASGGEAVVLRFGLFYGVGAAHSEEILALARRHLGFRSGRGDAYQSSIGARTWVSGPGRLAGLLGDRTTSLTRSLRVSNAAFRSATGWAPAYPSVHEGYRQMAAAL
ncbi:NAD-dependent epimerase/dehydratase family protein [Gordonia crocea]|uniref:NAD-dependent epimerase/dehydratase domain-containing protein n=1 Tax=Gordonia crocea TaxID=589162 RepID=A0A7I9V1L0_9ACTN|nr:NAD(P)H-binding protein [Gordonia crocea]GED99072.1 hypothetical protein nbrc107697_31110 [Gordonia crocea]